MALASLLIRRLDSLRLVAVDSSIRSNIAHLLRRNYAPRIFALCKSSARYVPGEERDFR
jgi:hypothetical protein